MHTHSLVSIVMGSKSDLPLLEHAEKVLQALEIPYEIRVASAHRTPDLAITYAAQAAERGVEVMIAAAGAAAALPGLIAAKTHLPVIGVPISATALSGLDSLLSIVQMPGGVPVATMAIGEAGAKNAALFAARIIALHNKQVNQALQRFIENQTQKAEENHFVR